MNITKASGETEVYRRDKFANSLLKAGVPLDICEKIGRKIEHKLKPGFATEKIHTLTSEYLLKENPVFSARYNLKKAIMELGPAGFLFERYLAALLKEYGYKVKVDQILEGTCISHEIDLVAQRGGQHFFIEAKYHNSRGVKTDVTVALYSYARFLDLKEATEKKEAIQALHEAWLITNTKFTYKAIEYGECKGMKMTGWHYPKTESLEMLIEQKSLYPLTVLPSLSGFARERFAKAGIMFAKDITFFQPLKLARKIKIPLFLAKKLVYEAGALGSKSY